MEVWVRGGGSHQRAFFWSWVPELRTEREGGGWEKLILSWGVGEAGNKRMSSTIIRKRKKSKESNF